MLSKSDGHYVLKIPSLDGYKTLTVNLAVVVIGLASAIWPRLAAVDAQAVTVLLDATTGAVVAGLGLVNVLLRMLTTGPAGSRALESSSSAPTAPADGSKDAAPTSHLKASELPPVTVSEALSDDAHAGRPMYCVPAVLDTCEPYRPAPAQRSELAQMARVFLLACALPVLALGGLTACNVVSNISAVAQAETLEQRAFALYGTFVVAETRAAEIMGDVRVPLKYRLAIQRADRAAKPSADALRAAAQALQTARTAPPSDGSAARVSGAVDTLRGATATGTPRIQALIDIVATPSPTGVQ